MDGDGNAVGLNTTINSGAGIVTPGLGFLHNNRMWSFNPEPGFRNSIAAGKSPLQGGGPTILLRGDQAAFVIGSPGGSRGRPRRCRPSPTCCTSGCRCRKR